MNEENKSIAITINDIIIGVAASLIFPFAAWLIDIISNDLPIKPE